MDEQVNQPTNSGSKSMLPQLEDFLNLYLVQKAPFQLPSNVKEFIVKFGPYITVVLMLLALPVILIALGLSAFFLPFGYAATGLGIVSLASIVVVVISLIFEALAIPGLIRRSKSGWNFVFYALILSAINSLIRFDIFSLIVGTLISSYFLFQIRSYYK